MSRLLVGAIKLYQVTLSPLLGQNCRFSPTCSQYALDAIGKFGAMKGSWYAFRRILRCQPFSKGGYDPIP